MILASIQIMKKEQSAKKWLVIMAVGATKYLFTVDYIKRVMDWHNKKTKKSSCLLVFPALHLYRQSKDCSTHTTDCLPTTFTKLLFRLSRQIACRQIVKNKKV